MIALRRAMRAHADRQADGHDRGKLSGMAPTSQANELRQNIFAAPARIKTNSKGDAGQHQ